jgi:hypothetical protein
MSDGDQRLSAVPIALRYLAALSIQFGAIFAKRLVARSRQPVMGRDFAAWATLVVVMMMVLFGGVKRAYF